MDGEKTLLDEQEKLKVKVETKYAVTEDDDCQKELEEWYDDLEITLDEDEKRCWLKEWFKEFYQEADQDVSKQ